MASLLARISPIELEVSTYQDVARGPLISSRRYCTARLKFPRCFGFRFSNRWVLVWNVKSHLTKTTSWESDKGLPIGEGLLVGKESSLAEFVRLCRYIDQLDCCACTNASFDKEVYFKTEHCLSVRSSVSMQRGAVGLSCEPKQGYSRIVCT
jgi:hypothetical protein